MPVAGFRWGLKIAERGRTRCFSRWRSWIEKRGLRAYRVCGSGIRAGEPSNGPRDRVFPGGSRVADDEDAMGGKCRERRRSTFLARSVGGASTVRFLSEDFGRVEGSRARRPENPLGPSSLDLMWAAWLPAPRPPAY